MGRFGADHEESDGQSHGDDGYAGKDRDGVAEHSKVWEMDEDENLPGTNHVGYANDDDDDDLEDGKMVGATSYGDRCFALASGLRFRLHCYIR
jgi:hypothetical protein